MDCVAVLLNINCEDDEEGDTSILKRNLLRNTSNPIELCEKTFRMLFRLSKDSFKTLLDEIMPKLKVAKNSRCIPPILKLAATIRFIAHGSYQQSVGQDYLIAMAQPTVSVVMGEVLAALESFCPKYINFDRTNEEKLECKTHYYTKTGFPGIIGCIDGMHVNIIRPVLNEHHFYNRKGNHSINVMATCNQNLLITSVDANHAGRSHDSFIWFFSAVRTFLEDKNRNGDRSSWILGDSGFPLESWLMTPYRNAVEGTNEAKFNEIHSKCRVTIERCFGVLKSRFRCLLSARQLNYQPRKAAQIINVACMLHNICISKNVDFDEALFVTEENHVSVVVADSNTTSNNLLREGKIIRNRIKDIL